ncbi:hypothetical protein QJS10_CPB15g01090 [Acorus calamus]|uniref:Peroxiredoxin-like 2A n=1 Tax=Acorus calamus TaxID=4465 RepID=A0AAV9D931_ACOCL|nr:hypothetical protein QJS10_CPB15g01090 [Acorus calamus]
MASFLVEEFIGGGPLKELVPKMMEEGFDDVPKLKMMNSDDMDRVAMTHQQKDALEIRTYLHDRFLMRYADKLEASGKPLAELLNYNTTILSSQYGMVRGQAARFGTQSKLSNETNHVRIKEGHAFKGIVTSAPVEARLCGCIRPPPMVENVSPYSSIENISIEKLAPEYKIGMERLVKSKAPPMKASELWKSKLVVLLCVRRPGCIMCRAEAHHFYARKPVFDALGVQLIAVLLEEIEAQVKDFWPRYWGGVVILDRGKEFFRALGGGKQIKENFITGFVFNAQARANYRRAKATGLERNFRGKDGIKGGLLVVGRGRSGIAYQFIERNFGDSAPIDEVIEICSQLQK